MAWPLGGAPSRLVKRLVNGKDPFDITPVTVDWRNTLKAVPGDSIPPDGSVAANIARNDDLPADLALAAPVTISPDGTQTTVWVTQGSIGHEYMVSMRATTTEGAQYERSFIIPVVQR
jgi:hypothetical protein